MILPSLFVVASLAALASAPSHAPGAPARTAAADLPAGTLDAIEPLAIRADIDFLASDELGGRDTPSSGLRVAARYIVSRLERLGWQPAAPEGWFYRYWLDYSTIDPQGSSIVVERSGDGDAPHTVELAFGSDYFFFASLTADDVWEAEVVFCGGGTSEEFDAVDVEGKWALCWHGDLSWRKRQVNAKRAGALGMIVTPGPDYDEEPYETRYRSWATARPQPRWPSSFERELFPASYLAATACERAFPEVARAEVALGDTLPGRVRETRASYGVGGQVELENVVALWPGSDPELASEVLLVSAHYDHVGTTEDGAIYNGADDNGSGSTGLLAVAEALAANGPLRRSVCLIWVSAEEKGLLGSRAWATYPWLPDGYRPICNINIDMIGRNAPDSLLITPTAEHEAYSQLTRIAERLAPLEGFPTLGNADTYYHRSDQAMFQQHLELPVAFLFTDIHEDYHEPTDTPEKIDVDKIRRVARLVVRMLAELQTDELEIEAAPEAVWRTARARGDVLALVKAAEFWANRNDGRAPASLDDLLVPGPDDQPPAFPRKALPVDPWGRPYGLVRPSDYFDGFEVRSFGKDGKPGGKGEDADVSSAAL